MGIVYVYDDGFSTKEETENAYKRALSVIKLYGDEKEFVSFQEWLDIKTYNTKKEKFKFTYNIDKVVIYNPLDNLGYLSGTIYLTIKKIYNITHGENVTDEYDVPKRLIEDFIDELSGKVYKYFRISTDIDITYKGIS
jgi:hypothetical protein